MIEFQSCVLANGLRVIVSTDRTTPFVTLNTLFDVGSKDEDPSKTGFAHLFEHLMFSGSANAPDFDKPVQLIGGENNAFTNTDITNYYTTAPKENAETLFWLESDRMVNLNINQHSLNVQKNVVAEEFKQRYINRPYGDIWMLLRPMAFRKHPYQWATIGKEISHIEQAELADVKQFYASHYRPAKAILAIAGNIEPDEAFRLCEKWYGGISSGSPALRKLPQEPAQTEARRMHTERKVPVNLLVKAYRMCARTSGGFYAADLISDILSGGNSSRLYLSLVKEQRLFSDIHAYVSGELDPGLFTFSGSLLQGVSYADAEKALEIEIEKICTEEVPAKEVDKVINKMEASNAFSLENSAYRAMALAKMELYGNAELINTETELYRQVSAKAIKNAAAEMFCPSKCSTLIYAAAQ
jgi:zinc protease